MKKKIVFMLQNGIGFGHFKLALTISRYLKDECDISFITQAKSTLIFDNYNYKVYNFPMLYTLKSNNEILIMNKLLNSLIEDIQPDVVIEDTYPEDFYLNLPALRNVSKILLMNRLSASEFENFYYNGIINQYDKLIVLKDKTCFINDVSSKEVKNYIDHTDRIVYLSGVYNEPSKEVENEVRIKYNLDKFDKNIVVSCGAGGWHIGSNICEEIFERIITITHDLVKEGINVQTILVLGPYSKYLEHKFEKIIDSHIKIVDFETNLDALFHVVDLSILRPGYNSTMEAISGPSNVLLLPGISYMEDQNIWCKELSEQFGIDFLNIESLDNISVKVRALLHHNTRTDNTPVNNTKKVAEVILKTINWVPTNSSIHLLINNMNEEDLTITHKSLKNVEVLKKEKDIISIGNTPVLNMSKIPPNKYSDYDSFIIYNDVNLEFNNASYYETRYHLSSSGYIIVEYEEIIFKTTSQLLNELSTIIKSPQRFNGNIIIKIPVMTLKEIDQEILEPLNDYVLKNKVEICDFESLLKDSANNKISNFRYGYYRPEIAKLN